jgi:hypothetical protein
MAERNSALEIASRISFWEVNAALPYSAFQPAA